MTRLSKAHRQAWRVTFATHTLVTKEGERELAEAGLPGLHVYDVLYRLYLSEGRAMRMHQLADVVVLSRSGLTRLADRLESDGLVERRICSVDRRGFELVLLPAGIEMLRSQWAIYSRVVAELFAPHVTRPELVVEQLEPVVTAFGIPLPQE